MAPGALRIDDRLDVLVVAELRRRRCPASRARLAAVARRKQRQEREDRESSTATARHHDAPGYTKRRGQRRAPARWGSGPLAAPSRQNAKSPNESTFGLSLQGTIESFTPSCRQPGVVEADTLVAVRGSNVAIEQRAAGRARASSSGAEHQRHAHVVERLEIQARSREAVGSLRAGITEISRRSSTSTSASASAAGRARLGISTSAGGPGCTHATGCAADTGRLGVTAAAGGAPAAGRRRSGASAAREHRRP